MVRIALAYLGIAVLGILVVTGLPFEWPGTLEVAEANGETAVNPAEILAAPEVLSEADGGFFLGVMGFFEGYDVADAAIGPSAPLVENQSASLVTNGTIAETTALILKELSMPAPANVVANTELEMSPDLLATFLVADQAASNEDDLTLETLLARALAAGQTAAEIDRLINEAASQGSVRVPAMMVTTEGRVDTMVLMASVVAKTKHLPHEEGDTSSADSFITAETAILDIKDMTYLVQQGDSIGGLALKFYGNPALFKPIFDANRQVLATPTSIRTGQNLIIPSRSKL